MDLSIYFKPVEVLEIDDVPSNNDKLGRRIVAFIDNDFPEFQKYDLAIIGVMEERNSLINLGTYKAPEFIRDWLANLYFQDPRLKICDLGNIHPGHSVEDTYFALKNVVYELIKANTIPIIIGGSQDLTYANYLAYEDLEQIVNLVTIDPKLDFGEADGPLNESTYLSKILLHNPNYLFNYSNIGYQSYFVSKDMLGLMDELHFDVHRLGVVTEDLKEIEPIVRNGDIMSFDISSIRYSDAPGYAFASPHGFYGEEACQICRYAGMSDKLSSIGFYGLNPEKDPNGQTAHLVAQLIWHFIDGFYNRKHDFPIGDKSTYTKYRVAIKDYQHELIFYKSDKSDRWWMDVPYPASSENRYARHKLIPCSYKDYQTACNDEVPDKWLSAYQKL